MPRPTDRSVSEHIGKLIEEQREKRGLSRVEFAAAMDMSDVALHHYEKGNRRITVETLHTVSGLLGKPISFFFKDLETPAPEVLKPQAKAPVAKAG